MRENAEASGKMQKSDHNCLNRSMLHDPHGRHTGDPPWSLRGSAVWERRVRSRREPEGNAWNAGAASSQMIQNQMVTGPSSRHCRRITGAGLRRVAEPSRKALAPLDNVWRTLQMVSQSAARTSWACSAGFTVGQIFLILPSGPIRNVTRCMPWYFRPRKVFSPQTP